MLTYHILYNPHAGSGRGQEATYRLNALLPDDRLLFRDITEIDDYGAFFRSLRDDDRVVIAGGDGTLNRFINDTAPPRSRSTGRPSRAYPPIARRHIHRFRQKRKNDSITERKMIYGNHR